MCVCLCVCVYVCVFMCVCVCFVCECLRQTDIEYVCVRYHNGILAPELQRHDPNIYSTHSHVCVYVCIFVHVCECVCV